MNYYLAIDLGASSGRHMLANIFEEKIDLKEIHRFDNNVVKKNNSLCWEIDKIFDEIIIGLKKCKEIGKIPSSIGIDTWGVDFVLLDEKDNIIGDTIAYRDHRTNGIDKEIEKIISYESLFERTGIHKNIFNTIYQLYAIKLKTPEVLKRAKTLLFIPDYLNFLLTGIKATEYTIASTSALVDLATNDWDFSLIEMIGLPKQIFGKITMPKTKLGKLKPEIVNLIGYNATVVQPCEHDTGSAVVALPCNNDNRVFISSGTWSLLGTESLKANNKNEARTAGYSNEGGTNIRYRFLKNIMGLWIIQSVRRNLDKKFSFDELETMARENINCPTLFDVNDDVFLFPENMISAVNQKCCENGFAAPKNIGETMAIIYNSLAHEYAKSISDLEKISGKTYSQINIIGGGCKDKFLTELTAKYSGKTVFAGPSEATSIGNIVEQMISAGEIKNLEQARDIINNSFLIEKIK